MADTSVPDLNNTSQPQEGFRRAVDQTAGIAEKQQIQLPRKRINWSLLLGFLIVFLVVLLAIIGPSIAPRDPMEENVILQINGKWLVPPFPLFTQGFPLGTDDGGDMYSGYCGVSAYPGDGDPGGNHPLVHYVLVGLTAGGTQVSPNC
jgi:hypothetical protein